jgi:class 3 adenylate cyclase/predicted ATPase
MSCPSCGANVPDGSKFCGDCGSALSRPCGACGRTNPTGAKFCVECGASFPSDTAAKRPKTESEPAPKTSEAERRQLTIMFCDMVGSSALSTRLDAEVQRDVVSAFQSCCAKEIKRLGGMVAQYLGDGVLAYFGYPRAHEDDAERAVRAGLAIIDAVGQSAPTRGVALHLRIGVASGVVVVGDLVREGVTQENAAIGETTNLAARLKSIADPDTLLICPVTYRLVGILFEYRDRGEHVLKGFVAPVHVRQVMGASKVENRFEARRADVSAPLLGRDEELTLLLRRWRQAKRGEGRVVLVTGEPGIGKSRLVHALQDRLRSERYTRLNYYCSPYQTDTALYPISAQLLRAAGIEPNDSAGTRFEKLEFLLALSSDDIARHMPLFAALLSIPGGGRHSLPALTPQQVKERTLNAMIYQLKRLCSAQPVLMVFEDLHWIDPTSLEVLCRMIEEAPNLRLLLLATGRTEFTPPWPNHWHTSTVALTRLGRSEVETLVSGVTQGKALPEAVLEQIASRTDGVPLFVEELTKTVLESGLLRETGDHYELAGALPGLAIPSTLHASLIARLDRLASAKDIAQIGAVIGREFSFALILVVSGLSEKYLREALAQLVAAELIFQRGLPPEATYIFKHTLLQDAAYGSMLRAKRQQIHADVKRALEDRLPEVVEAQPELLAFHCSEAGLVEEALVYWERAGQRAARRSANREATGHFRKALELLERTPQTAERDGHELNLLIVLGPALMATLPSADPQVVNTYARARELAARTGRSAELFPTLWGAHIISVVAGNHATADRLVDELFSIAQSLDDPGFLLQAHHAAFSSRKAAGDLVGSQDHAAVALDLYRPEEHGRHAQVYGAHDPATCARMNVALMSLLRGFPDRARAEAELGLALARSLPHPPTLIHAMRLAAELYNFCGEWNTTTDLTAELLQLSVQHASAVGRANATLLGGWARIMRGQRADGLKDVEEGLRLWRQTGSKLHVAQRLAAVAQSFIAADQPGPAWQLLAEAFEAAEQLGEHFFKSELYRLKGDLLLILQDGRQDDTMACYEQALSISRTQDARLLELRAATGLARLWLQQDRQRDAAVLLGPVYKWFSEGFDLPDLQAAKALLERLAA